MKFISWNVNGLRACMQKGFLEFFKEIDADFFSIQETKMQEGQLDLNIEGYHYYMSSAIKKGYSGTLIYTKHKPLNVIYGINDKYNDEGRVITLEFENFYYVACYVPNAGDGLKRLDFRMEFEERMTNYLKLLDLLKPVIYAGDLNVAHKEIDLKNPKANVNNPGFTIEERNAFSKLLEYNFIDTYRYKYPNAVKYTWWSYRFNARANNAGWRIDYFVVSDRIKEQIEDSLIHNEIMGSDHCPIELIIKI